MQNLRKHQLTTVCLVVPLWLAVKCRVPEVSIRLEADEGALCELFIAICLLEDSSICKPQPQSHQNSRFQPHSGTLVKWEHELVL